MNAPRVHPRTKYGELIKYCRFYLSFKKVPPHITYEHMVSIIARHATLKGERGGVARILIYGTSRRQPTE